ncbi:MAG: alanine racemase [Candidatus Omnitrophica bacterium]|nr:alanine racemase [Candidatus Omnitrophota bacterium]
MAKNNYLQKAKSILEQKTPVLKRETLRDFVGHYLKSKDVYLDACKKFGSPLYLIDEPAIVRKAREFRVAFEKYLPKVKIFYALKSNYHPFLIRTLVKEGYGIDVSSGRELEMALRQKAASMIFSGPGKTVPELELACDHHDKVIVLIDNFDELERLQRVANRKNIKIRAGIRLMIEEKGLWRKFGIPLRLLSEFFKQAADCRNIDLCGLQFHASWNLDTTKQVAILRRLKKVLSTLDKKILSKIHFVDIGGGYWPVQGEWMQPSATPEGNLKQSLDPLLTQRAGHYCLPSLGIDQFAQQIAQVIERELFPYTQCEIYLEPGRWICHEAMHILFSVVDKKAEDVVIADAGTNTVGWERFETDYFPVINLTHPSLDEKSCMIFGSLCTPHDIWGYNYFGKTIEKDDVLMIPTQGAYTYSLRQEFIKNLPQEVIINDSGTRIWKETPVIK